MHCWDHNKIAIKNIRGGSGQFFSPRVGFRVFWFCSGRVSGFLIFFRVKGKISRVTFGSKKYRFGSTRVKNFFAFSVIFCQFFVWSLHLCSIFVKNCNIFHYFLTSGYSGLAKFTSGCENITSGWRGLSEKLLGSGRVGQKALGSGFDPTHP